MSEEEILRLCNLFDPGGGGLVDEDEDRHARIEYVRELTEAVRQYVNRERWMPVGERLPETDLYVLGARDDGTTWIYFRDHRDREFKAFGCSGDDYTITHWRPLPPPPAKDGERHG